MEDLEDVDEYCNREIKLLKLKANYNQIQRNNA